MKMRVTDEDRRCAVFMPMLLGYEGIRAAVQSAIEHTGLTMHRLEELLPDSEWQLWVARAAQAADLVLADVTDHNPFVMYELATAHALHTPTLLIVNRRDRAIPATVKGSFFLSYDDENLVRFVPRLERAIRRTLCLDWRSEHAMPVESMYQAAKRLLTRLNSQAGAPLEAVSEQEFCTLIEVAQRRGQIPALNSFDGGAAAILLARLVRGSDDCEIMELIEENLAACGNGSIQ